MCVCSLFNFSLPLPPDGKLKNVINFENSKSIDMQTISVDLFGRRSYLLTCVSLTERNVNVAVSNAKSDKLPYPALVKESFVFVCAEPSTAYIALKSDNKFLPDLHLSAIPTAVRNARCVEAYVVLQDSNTIARSFTNFTSLDIKWSANNHEFGRINFPSDTDVYQPHPKSLIELCLTDGTSLSLSLYFS